MRESLWDRLKRARVVQVVVVYLGAAWVILEIAWTLTEALALPAWISPLAIILLLIGLLVIVATAWVQSLPATTAAEEAGEVPGDWELAPGEVLASLRAGRLPHLTWGRTILGGVVALSLLFGGAGLYVLIQSGGSGAGGDIDAPVEAAPAIAILPFNVSGAEHQLYREGMVDLLSANLDGVGGLRTIDSRTVLARWDREVGDAEHPDLAVALRAAGATGARYAVLGSMVPVGPALRLDAQIYEAADGTELGSARVEGSAEEMLALVDGLSVGIAGELLRGSGESASQRRLASITTGSLEALEAYLEGEKLYREGNFVAAGEAFERAVAIDSTFALAWLGLGAAKSWLPGEPYQRARGALAEAVRFVDRLGPREALLARAWHHLMEREPGGIPIMEDFVRRYPDESEGWYLLAELYIHLPGFAAVPVGDIRYAFARAIELDPSFAGYYIHPVDLAFRTADSVDAGTLIDAYWAEAGEVNLFSRHWESSFDLYFGDDTVRAAALDTALELPDRRLALGGQALGRTDRPARELPFLRAVREEPRSGDPGLATYLRALRRAGRWSEARPLAEGQPANGTAMAERIRWFSLYGLGDGDRIHDDLAAEHDCASASRTSNGNCRKWVTRAAAYAGHAGEAEANIAEIERLLREATEELGADSPEVRAIDYELAQARAWAALTAGEPGRAVEIWREREGRAEVDFLCYAMALEATGDLEAAARYYATQTWRNYGAFATYRLAQVYERMGSTDEAVEQYAKLLMMWEAADPDFAPLLDARQAVRRLGGMEGS